MILFIKVFIGTAAFFAAVWMLIQWITTYENRHLRTVVYTIRDSKLPIVFQGKRIAFLSDLHNYYHGSQQEILLKKIQEQKPDLICIGGDMMIVKKWSKDDFHPLFLLLDALCPDYPVVYADGNHEQRMKEEADLYPGWYETFIEGLRQRGVIYLQDETVCLQAEAVGGISVEYPMKSSDCGCQYQENTILLSGLSLEMEYYRKLYFVRKLVLSEHYLEQKLPALKQETFHILLAHTPQFAEEYIQAGADLVFCGHFHGGCVRLPFFGSVVSPQLQLFPKYAHGYRKKDDAHVIVSAGLGTHSVNIRVNNPPELVMIELQHAENGQQNG